MEICISYNDGLKGNILLKNECGIIPIELKDDELKKVSFYSHIMEKLIEGNKLYIKDFNGYIGNDIKEGPYGEDRYFSAEYYCYNADLDELLHSLDKCIRNNEKCLCKINK